MSHLIQGTAEWEQWRKSKIGASDIPIIMGESTFKTPYRLWQEKTGRAVPYVNKYMLAGKEKEAMIRHKYEVLTGHHMFPVVFESDKYPHFIASVDGITLCGNFGCELKLANPIDHALALDGKIPPKYYGQLQWCMYLSGLSSWDYVSYGRDCETMAIVPCARDERYIVPTIVCANIFYDHVKNDMPPEHKEYETEITDDEYECFTSLAEIIRNRQFWEALEEEEKIKAKEKANGRNIIACGICIEKTAGRSFIDYASIPELQNVDLEKYRKPGKETYRISLKDEK